MRCFLASLHLKENLMDAAYLGLAVVFWLLLAGMAKGCAKLGGPKQ
jgi:hypothetical protein